ncbi:O-antigen ligase family protein [Providencia stuartii]|nr:O-antigen ligase family protein [Providencia stuartii]EMD5260125.1 O-antigen ligase family protein [Providencia stuartii]
MNKLLLFLLFFLSGVTNDVLKINIVKSWSLIEIYCVFVFFVLAFSKKILLNKVIYSYISLLVGVILSLLLNLSSFSFEHYVTDVSSIGTTYGPRMVLSFLQMLFGLICIISSYSLIKASGISNYEISNILLMSISLFSLIGIIFLIMNSIGIQIPIIQSNEKSYGSYRLYSLSVEPQFAALFISLGVAISLHLKKKVLFILNILALVLTLSTTALVGLVIATIYYIHKKYSIKYRIFIAPVIILSSVILIYLSIDKIQLFFNLMTTGENLDALARVKSIFVAYDLFKGNPMFGVGWGNFSFYFDWRGNEVITNIGNLFLRIIVETGLVGFILFIPILYWFYCLFKISNVECKSYLIILLVYFMTNSTAFLQPVFWITTQYIYIISRQSK